MRADELVGLALALEEREGLEERDRRRSDREAHAALESALVGASIADRRALIRHWLAFAPSSAAKQRIRRVRSTLRGLRGLLFGIGLFVGWATAAALLRFEVHAGRINIVLFLGIVVLLPFATVLLAAIGVTLFSRGHESAEPGAGVQGGWRSQVLARGAMAALPESLRADFDVLLGRLSAHDRLYARVQRMQLFVWSQWIGVAFSLGALAAFLGFVVFTDLAFGWSTTLDVEASKIHAFVEILASPWASIWPEASPSLDLVETTRHFRIATNDPHVHFIDPIRYGAWWPFLVMMLVVYTLIPRLLLLGMSALCLRTEVAAAIFATPGVERLVERIWSPIVETRAPEVEAPLGQSGEGQVGLIAWEDWLERTSRSTNESMLAIAWAESISDEALILLCGGDDVRIRDAGGRRSLAEDAEVIRAAADSPGAVAIFVRAYEPPMLDTLDFLADLRRATGNPRPLVIGLLGGTTEDAETWRRKLFTLGDPGLFCSRVEGRAE